MSIELAKQPLKIREGSCLIEKVKGEATEKTIHDWIKKYFPEEAEIVIWQMQSVVWGISQEGNITLSDSSEMDCGIILEARIFNKKAELHIVRVGNLFVGRYISDDGQQKIKYVDSLARLWGEKSEKQGLFVKLEDKNRKLALVVPCLEEATFYGLVTRNYIGYAEQNGQAGYVDYRYVQITSAEGGKQ